jgi:hypothetical protein
MTGNRQPIYRLCQRNYMVLSGLRPFGYATITPIPIARSIAWGQETHHENRCRGAPSASRLKP